MTSPPTDVTFNLSLTFSDKPTINVVDMLTIVLFPATLFLLAVGLPVVFILQGLEDHIKKEN